MAFQSLNIVLVSTPIGSLGSGKGGGVELTLISLMEGLVKMGNKVVLVCPEGSSIPPKCEGVEVRYVLGVDQPSWQHQEPNAPVVIPENAVLPRLLEEALDLGESADAVLNFSYDWLSLWITRHVNANLFHLISMGGVSQVMKEEVKNLSIFNHSRLAFHTFAQAADYELSQKPIVVGNGFEIENYFFKPQKDGPLGWAGRVAPEKGLEDAAKVASNLGEKLLVWGLVENELYAKELEKLFPSGTIIWRGFLKTEEFQRELGTCRALINTPKWNEAYGNVVVESLACGVPVIAYNRGGPGELIESGKTGWLVAPDNVAELTLAVKRVNEIDRGACREWAQKRASNYSFAKRVHSWIESGLFVKNK